MMDNKVSGIALFLVLVLAGTGILLFNNLNPEKALVNNSVIDQANQTETNNTLINDNVLPSTFLSSSTVNLISSSPGGQPTPSPTPPTPDPMDHIISLFDTYLTSTFPMAGIPGAAVVVVQNNEIIYMKCFGVKDLTTQALVGPNTLFEIGSSTKQFSATNIAQLVDAGLMGWDDPIIDYYPDKNEFQLYSDEVTDSITLRDCLLHRSGLPMYGGDSNVQIFNYSYEFGLHQLRYLENTTKFRSTWQYNNMLYALPSNYAERATNTPWKELMKLLLEPLGMNTATTNYNDFLNSPDHATPYRTINGTMTPFHLAGLDAMGPSGSLACSIREMANWLSFQIDDTGIFNGQQVVSKTNLDETRTGQIEVPGVGQYGFGWMVSNGVLWHAGDTLSSGSYLEIIPSKGLAIAVLATGGQYGYAFNMAAADKFNLLLMGIENYDPWPSYKQYAEGTMKPVLDPPAPPIVSPLPFSNYTGVYFSDFYGIVNITTNNTNLVCYYGNNSQPYDLKHWNDSVFTEETNNYAFNFTDIHDGVAHELTIKLSDPPTPAVFNRTNST